MMKAFMISLISVMALFFVILIILASVFISGGNKGMDEKDPIDGLSQHERSIRTMDDIHVLMQHVNKLEEQREKAMDESTQGGKG